MKQRITKITEVSVLAGVVRQLVGDKVDKSTFLLNPTKALLNEGYHAPAGIVKAVASKLDSILGASKSSPQKGSRNKPVNKPKAREVVVPKPPTIVETFPLPHTNTNETTTTAEVDTVVTGEPPVTPPVTKVEAHREEAPKKEAEEPAAEAKSPNPPAAKKSKKSGSRKRGKPR